MSNPSEGSPTDAPSGDETGEWYEVVHQGNLIYLPFARHLAGLDEAEEQERKAA